MQYYVHYCNSVHIARVITRMTKLTNGKAIKRKTEGEKESEHGCVCVCVCVTGDERGQKREAARRSGGPRAEGSSG